MIHKIATENITKYSRTNGSLEASVHQREDNGLWQVMDFSGRKIEVFQLATRRDAEKLAEQRVRYVSPEECEAEEAAATRADWAAWHHG